MTIETLLIFILFVTIVKSKDYVFSAALGYDESSIEPFVVSLRWCGFTGEIWIAVNQNDEPKLLEFSKTFSVKLFVMPNPEQRKVNTMRFEWYDEWAAPFQQGDNILISDLRDGFFQANPFLHHYYNNARNVQFFEEKITIGECKWNSWWIVDCYGNEELSKLSSKAAICSGSIIGDAVAMKKFLKTFISGMRNITKCQEDQGTFNYLYYNRYFDRRVVVNKQGHGAANTLGYVKERDLPIGNTSLFILNNDGIRSALIHQYDRHPELTQHYRRLVPFMKYMIKRNV